MKLQIDERQELIEETEARMVGGINALICLLNRRIDELADAGARHSYRWQKATRKQLQKYLKRLEKRYYAALQARARGDA